MKKLIAGVGINDIGKPKDKIAKKALFAWYNMLKRCYDEKHHNHKFYYCCYVCDEWLVFSSFQKWFCDNYIEGYQLDKDILVKGNKVYSPETCCFVPQEINKLVLRNPNKKDGLPLGVYYENVTKKYVGIGQNNTIKRFNTPQEAFVYYKTQKENHIKILAEKYFSEHRISENIYNSLIAFEI